MKMKILLLMLIFSLTVSAEDQYKDVPHRKSFSYGCFTIYAYGLEEAGGSMSPQLADHFKRTCDNLYDSQFGVKVKPLPFNLEQDNSNPTI